MAQSDNMQSESEGLFTLQFTMAQSDNMQSESKGLFTLQIYHGLVR